MCLGQEIHFFLLKNLMVDTKNALAIDEKLIGRARSQVHPWF